MTESEYLDATNLAKIRIANRCLRDCLFVANGVDEACQQVAARAILEIIENFKGRFDNLEESE